MGIIKLQTPPLLIRSVSGVWVVEEWRWKCSTWQNQLFIERSLILWIESFLNCIFENNISVSDFRFSFSAVGYINSVHWNLCRKTQKVQSSVACRHNLRLVSFCNFLSDLVYYRVRNTKLCFFRFHIPVATRIITPSFCKRESVRVTRLSLFISSKSLIVNSKPISRQLIRSLIFFDILSSILKNVRNLR